MSDGDLLLGAIIAAPDDDTPRLAYADWLDEQGQARGKQIPCPRAAYIRAKILGGVPNRGLGPWPSWAGTLQKIGDSRSRVWSRGFVGEVRLPAAAFLAHAASIFAQPVTVVRHPDRQPEDLGYGWGWQFGAVENGPEFLPEAYRHSNRGEDDDTVWVRANAADCVKAMELRAVVYGRRLAGLTPLLSPVPVGL